MTTAATKSSYRQPLATNGFLLFALLVGYWVLRSRDIAYASDIPHPSLGDTLKFIASVGLIPLINFLCIIYSLIVKKRKQAGVYGIAWLITFLATSTLWLYCMPLLHKIGG